MNKCKNESCSNEVKSIHGRKPKLFCSSECRIEFYNSKKVKGVGRGRPKGSKNKSKTIVVKENSAADKILAELSENKKQTEIKVKSITTHPKFEPPKEIKIDLSDKDAFLNS